MIHVAYLVAKRDDYSYFDLSKRKNIFWALFYFAKRAPIKFHTIIIDKKYKNRKAQLKSTLFQEVLKFIQDLNSYICTFSEIVVYYDDGQETLAKVLDMSFSNIENLRKIVNFDHTEKKLFQVADMLTVVDKIIYKNQNKFQFTNAEKQFFLSKDIPYLKKSLDNKRI